MDDLSTDGVTLAERLKNWLESGQNQVAGVIQEIGDAAIEGYEISEIELSARGNADDKATGFGVGGEASFVIRIRPTD